MTTSRGIRAPRQLSEYVMAWGTEQGVQWSPTSIGEEVPA